MFVTKSFRGTVANTMMQLRFTVSHEVARYPLYEKPNAREQLQKRDANRSRSSSGDKSI